MIFQGRLHLPSARWHAWDPPESTDHLRVCCVVGPALPHETVRVIGFIFYTGCVISQTSSTRSAAVPPQQ